MSEIRNHYRTCPLCEAGCGLEIGVRDGAVTRIRGDMADVYSHGFICPKGSTLRQLHDAWQRNRELVILPSHCRASAAAFRTSDAH